MTGLFGRELAVINVGLSSFAGPIAAAGAPVVDVDWSPPAEGDAAVGRSPNLPDGPKSIPPTKRRSAVISPPSRRSKGWRRPAT